MVRRALTRQTRWYQNRCSIFKIKDFIVQKPFWKILEFWPLVTSFLTWAKKWPKWFRNDFSRAFERRFSFCSTMRRSRDRRGGVQTPPPPQAGRGKSRGPAGRGLTRALLVGGRLNAPPPPLRFFKSSENTAARSAAKFSSTLPPSFPQLLWKFRPNAMWGQVTRSGQVTQLQNNFPIAPRLQCFRESYQTFRIWWAHQCLQNVYLGILISVTSGQVIFCDLPIIPKSMGKKSTSLYLLWRKHIWVESYRIGQLWTIRVKFAFPTPWKVIWGHPRLPTVICQ